MSTTSPIQTVTAAQNYTPQTPNPSATLFDRVRDAIRLEHDCFLTVHCSIQ